MANYDKQKKEKKSNIIPFSLSSYNFKVDEFAMRSLNKYRNFMSAPECDCGCGGKGRLIFETKEELYGFCNAVLGDMDCCECAIFIIHNDGIQEIIYKHLEWDEDVEEECVSIDLLSPKNDKVLQDTDFFAKLDAEFGFHCYGLMIERDNGSWEICE